MINIPIFGIFEEKYSISDQESMENNTFLSLNFVLGDLKDGEIKLASEELDYILLNAPDALLKKAILDANIGTKVFNC